MDRPVLKNAKWLMQENTQQVFAVFERAGHQVRVVGGAVRNSLLGVSISDIDFATTALPQQVVDLAKQTGLKYIPTGLSHGTVTLVIDDENFEITTLRIDEQSDGRHAVVSFTQNWEADAMRRDFTVNALYCDKDGTLFDPLGGYKDLQNSHIAFIGDADERIKEDYLRILRFFRFFAQYDRGNIDETGLGASIKGGFGLSKISGERILVEMLKMLSAPRAVDAVTELYNSGLFLQCFSAVPWLARFKVMVAIENSLTLKSDALRRLAALFVLVKEDIAVLDSRLHLSKRQRKELSWFCLRLPLEDFKDADRLNQRLYKHGSKAIEIAFYRFLLDHPSSLKEETIKEIQAVIQVWQKPIFPLRGQDLLDYGFEAGAGLGIKLKALEAHWLAGRFKASKQALLRRAEKL